MLIQLMKNTQVKYQQSKSFAIKFKGILDQATTFIYVRKYELVGCPIQDSQYDIPLRKH